MQVARVLGGLAIAAMLSGSSCMPLNQHPVGMWYVHVADAKEVRFTQPVQIYGHYPINAISATNGGYWAIFWICRIAVNGPANSNYYFNPTAWTAVGNHEYAAHPMPTRGTTAPLNHQTEFEVAVDQETFWGPAPGELFPGGSDKPVSLRVAIFIPGDPGDDGRGSPLTLRSNPGSSVFLFQKQNDLLPQILDYVGGSIGNPDHGSYPPINYPRSCRE